MQINEAIAASENKHDELTKIKTIYDVSSWEIMWRNTLAGFSRVIGGLFAYILFFLIASILFSNLIWPKIMPSVNSIWNMFKGINSAPNTNTNMRIMIPNTLDLRRFLGQ